MSKVTSQISTQALHEDGEDLQGLCHPCHSSGSIWPIKHQNKDFDVLLLQFLCVHMSHCHLSNEMLPFSVAFQVFLQGKQKCLL